MIVQVINKIFGGIVGLSRSKAIIKNCKNIGEIEAGYASNIGGILGRIYTENLTIEECVNNGTIQGFAYVGGIVGNNAKICTISKCNNNETIEGYHMVGGIAGYHNGTISGCTNSGVIKGKGDRIGGILGVLSFSSKVEDCNNSGQVIGEQQYTGGIIGIIPTDNQDTSDKEKAIVRKCYNSGNIQGVNSTGGIIGTAAQYNSLIEKCYNLGEVYGTENSIGGIAGTFGRSSKIYNCYNMNKVTGVNRVGGVAGYSYKSAGEIKNCYNTGKVSGTSYVGGILGRNNNSSTIDNSYYLAGTATLDVGSGSTNNLAKNKEFITQDFVTTSNATETIWKVEAEKNDGWPILNE